MYENTIGRPERDPFETLIGVLAAADRYDILLLVVPVAFAVALVAASISSVSLVQAMLVAAVVGVAVVVDACYWNPPVDQGS
ncbi:hypothetical protein [Natronorubrum tibetense]|uniref:Uncharacterized protein n=1 Tax=Natronorubrum tibetense GA33 TaxID=1114856 RepID=L9VJR8_9EURY|nr:hypothetical protein [Natronorubrum tibetense]ELY36493.1 hypothetical protein C496_21427 [Natronorubrum tibetense GA33]